MIVAFVPETVYVKSPYVRSPEASFAISEFSSSTGSSISETASGSISDSASTVMPFSLLSATSFPVSEASITSDSCTVSSETLS